jgi:hypothetical protein
MRVAVTVVVQLLASLLIVGALLPLLIATMPAVRAPHTGLTVVIVGVVTIFGLLRLVWTRLRPKRE